jgi:hypothetical protein
MFLRDEKKNTFHDFVGFLQRISERKKGEHIDHTFGNLKVYFIGKNEILKKYAVAPYYRRIQNDTKNGTDVFYLLAHGNYHVVAADVLATLLSQDDIAREDDKYIGEITIEGKKIKTAIIRMVRSHGFTHEPLDALESEKTCEIISEGTEMPEIGEIPSS